LDAAVAVTVINANVAANVHVSDENGLFVGGDLHMIASSEGENTATSKGHAQSSKAAAGASVNVNVVNQAIHAVFNGVGKVAGDVQIQATSKTNDISNAEATASGVDLKKYTEKFDTSVDEIVDGQFGSKSDAKAESSATETSGKINEALYKDSEKTDSGKNVASAVLDSQNVKTEKVETSGVANSSTKDNTATDKNTTELKADGTGKNSQNATAQKDKNMSVAAAVGANIVTYNANM
jgi:hypothetical protein